MKRSISFLVVVFFTVQISSAQFFERIYPGLNLSYVGSLDNTIDSGFIICGNQDGAFLMKLNSAGDIEWTRTDTNDLKFTAAVVQNASGNFIVIGSGPSQVYNSIAVVGTFDDSGNYISDIRIPPSDGWGTWGNSISRSPDRQLTHYSYYVDGYTADNYYILDNEQVISGDMSAVGLNAISMDDNGNYYAVSNMDFDMDSLGNWHNNVLQLSSNHFQRNESFYNTNISASTILSDGNVMLAGLYDTLGTKFLRLMKFDSTDVMTWNIFISDTGYFSINQISQTQDGGYAILCGENINNPHISFLKLDQFGSVEWRKQFSGNGTANPRNFKILYDGYVILGSCGNDPYVIRTDLQGGTTSATHVESIKNQNGLDVFPNPSNGIFNISLGQKPETNIFLSVFDMQGKLIVNSELDLPLNQVDLSFLPKGVYHFNFTTDGQELKSCTFVIE